jgi:hypothetical protein
MGNTSTKNSRTRKNREKFQDFIKNIILQNTTSQLLTLNHGFIFFFRR